MEDLGLSAQEASEAALDYMADRLNILKLWISKWSLHLIDKIRVGGEGGLIAIDRWVLIHKQQQSFLDTFIQFWLEN